MSHARAIRKSFGGAAQRRFLFAVAARPAFYRRWFDYLDSGIRTRMPQAMRTELALRPVRPYLRRQFSANVKDRIARRHYRILDSLLIPAAVVQLRTDHGLTLAQFSGRNGRTYRLTVKGIPQPEGEVTIQLIDEHRGEPLAWLWGSFGPDGSHGTVFWVGALQGPRPPSGLIEIADATRDLHGLRPKQAVLHGLDALCTLLGAGAIYAPGNGNHISQTWERRFLGAPLKVRADLDAFWRDFTTERSAIGDYCISVPLRRRSIDQVQGKRRKEWRLRYEIVDGINAQVAANLAVAMPRESEELSLLGERTMPAVRDAEIWPSQEFILSGGIPDPVPA